MATSNEVKLTEAKMATSNEAKLTETNMATSHEAKLTETKMATGHEAKLTETKMATGREAKLSETKMATGHEAKLTEMKEQIQKLGSSAEKYGDPTLERFLIEKSLDPKKAAKMFVAWQKWRASSVPLGFMPDSEVLDELKPKKVFLSGLSKSGAPVMIYQACKHFASKDQDQSKKFFVYMLDKAIARGIKDKEIGNEKIVMIMNMQNIGYKNLDTHGFISGFQVLQAYYPQRLEKLYMLNMPWFFASFWKIVSRVLEKSTAEKIVMITNEKGKKQLIEEVGKEVLPEELGGTAELVPLQDVQVPRLEF